MRFDADGTIRLDNTDGLGLIADIQINAGLALAGRDLLLLGAGGAAAGVLGPLLQAAPRRIVLVNRTRARARSAGRQPCSTRGAACGRPGGRGRAVAA